MTDLDEEHCINRIVDSIIIELMVLSFSITATRNTSINVEDIIPDSMLIYLYSLYVLMVDTFNASL